MLYIVATAVEMCDWANRTAFEHVFGAQVGKSSPIALTAKFGKGTEVVRHIPEQRNPDRTFVRDDGWNWWYWPEANANVQCYWGPAYPISRRRIVRITICEAFKTDNAARIDPPAKTAGWLYGIRIGMPKSEALNRFHALFGAPGAVGYEHRWGSADSTLSVRFEFEKLSEIVVCIR